MRKESAVVWPGRPKWARRALISRLQKKLKGRVNQAYLFGSYALNQADQDSDVDVILVTETSLPWPERFTSFHDLLDDFGAMDLLIYTPAEWAEMKKNPSSLLLDAKENWKKLI